MEIGYEAVDNVVCISRGDEELGITEECICIVMVEPVKDVGEGFCWCKGVGV